MVWCRSIALTCSKRRDCVSSSLLLRSDSGCQVWAAARHFPWSVKRQRKAQLFPKRGQAHEGAWALFAGARDEAFSCTRSKRALEKGTVGKGWLAIFELSSSFPHIYSNSFIHGSFSVWEEVGGLRGANLKPWMECTATDRDEKSARWAHHQTYTRLPARRDT